MNYLKFHTSKWIACLFIILILIGNLWAGFKLTGQPVPAWLSALGQLFALITVLSIPFFLGEWAWRAKKENTPEP